MSEKLLNYFKFWEENRRGWNVQATNSFICYIRRASSN